MIQNFFKFYFKDIETILLWIIWLIYLLINCILKNRGILGKIVLVFYVLIVTYIFIKTIIQLFLKTRVFTFKKKKDYSKYT